MNLVIVELMTDETLYGMDGVFRINDCLAFGKSADEAFTVLVHGNHGRSGSITLLVFENFWVTAFNNGHGGVCCIPKSIPSILLMFFC